MERCAASADGVDAMGADRLAADEMPGGGASGEQEGDCESRQRQH